MVDDPLPPLPVFGSYSPEEWKTAKEGPLTPDSKELMLEQVGPLFGTTFLGAATYDKNINAGFTSLQKVIPKIIKLILSRLPSHHR